MPDRDVSLLEDLPRLEPTLPLGSVPQARVGASAYVNHVVDALVREMGFGFVGSCEPPRSMTDWEHAVAHSSATGNPLPVADHPDRTTALMGDDGDRPLAFWRSIVRIRSGHGFNPAGELSLDLDILDRAAFDGISIPARAVLYAALVGTTLCTAITGSAPSSPRLFTSDVLTYGLTDAILLEYERPSSPPPTGGVW